MQLVEQGKPHLHTDIDRYLDFQVRATYPQPVTLAHLLTPGFEGHQFGSYARSAGDLLPLGQFLAANVSVRIFPPGLVTVRSGTTPGSGRRPLCRQLPQHPTQRDRPREAAGALQPRAGPHPRRFDPRDLRASRRMREAAQRTTVSACLLSRCLMTWKSPSTSFPT